MPYQPRATLDNPYGPQVQFRTEDVLPPSAYYLGLDDQVLLQVYSDYPNNTINLTVRMLSPQGVIELENIQILTTAGGGTFYSQTMTGVEGYLLSACVTAGNAPVGTTYCIVFLARAPWDPVSLITAVLVAGYAGVNRYLSYPTMAPRGIREGPGQLRTVTVSPAAGADWTINVPFNTTWLLVGGHFNLVTSSAVADRIPTIWVKDAAGANVSFFPSPGSQPASTTYGYTIIVGAAGVSNPPFVTIATSDRVFMQYAALMSSFTSAIQPGDQYSDINIQVEEWVGL